MLISDRLDEIQARADKALAGPWEVNPFAHSVRKSGTNKVVCRLSVLDNASFIAHARTDVPALVAALRAVLAECEDREEVPEDSGSGADAARDIRRMIAAALGEES